MAHMNKISQKPKVEGSRFFLFKLGVGGVWVWRLGI